MLNRFCLFFIYFTDDLFAVAVFVINKKRSKREKPLSQTEGNEDNRFCVLYYFFIVSANCGMNIKSTPSAKQYCTRFNEHTNICLRSQAKTHQ